MRTFIEHDFPALKQITEEGKRLYRTPDGKAYPSVTTVTALHGEAGIAAWRARVGTVEANKISKRASSRGTDVHALCEAYLKGADLDTACSDMFTHEMFQSMRPELDRIDNIHCLETALYSHSLRVAGTVDVIGEYCGTPSAIDFKTAAKPKKREWIENYFMQTAAYSFMFWELTGILVKEAVIIIGVDNEETQVFKEPVVDWIRGFSGLREKYRVRTGI